MTLDNRVSEFFAYCGAHYKTCPVEIREIWSRIVALPGQCEALRAIIARHAHGGPVEIVPVSTCNRFDICVFGQITSTGLVEALMEFTALALHKDASLIPAETVKELSSPEKLRSFLRMAFDEEAVRLLFRVAGSLDSLVLGEPHILGQLKESFYLALEARVAGGEATGIFSRTFQVAKRIRTETELGRNGISIGHAAVEVSRRIYDNLRDVKALVIGAGEMGRIVAQHFKACGVQQLTVANRTRARGEMIASELGPSCAVMDLVQALDKITSFDVTVVATAGSDFVVKPLHLAQAKRHRHGRPGVIVDISVPRNVDPEAALVENMFVFDIDDLDKIMEGNREARRNAALAAEAIILAEVRHFLHSRRQRENLTNVGKFHSLVRGVVEREVSRSLRRGPQGALDPAVVADAVAKKLVSHAAALARSDTRAEGQGSVGEMLEFLFNLSLQETTPRTVGEPSASANVIPLRSQKSGGKE